MTGTAYGAEVLQGWTGREGEGFAAATYFQTDRWLGAWYRTLGADEGITPLTVLARAGDGRGAMLLPLILDTTGRRRVVAFADRGVSDYNAPLLGPAAPTTPAAARALWAAIARVLPPADLAVFEKMPLSLGDRPNPLALLKTPSPCPVFGNVLTIGDDFAAWRRQDLAKTFRKELERSWRVFERHGGAAFERVLDPATAHAVLDDLAALQGRRLDGEAYRLGRPTYDAFYHRLLDDGLADGSVVLTALKAEGQTVAALLGVTNGSAGYAMMRIANQDGPWLACSPGRLLIERTMAHLHEEGYRLFDFTIGDYPHKRRFNTTPVPLVDVALALSPWGLPRIGRAGVKTFVKARPALLRAARAARDLAARPGGGRVLPWARKASP